MIAALPFLQTWLKIFLSPWHKKFSKEYCP
jgi:hypothetical protein